MAHLSAIRHIKKDIFVFQAEQDFQAKKLRLQTNKYCAHEHSAWQAALNAEGRWANSTRAET